MNIFFVLVRKEIKELVSKQLIVSIAAMLFIFHVIGKLTGEQAAKATSANSRLVVVDLDRSDLSARLALDLEKTGYMVALAELPGPEEALASPDYAGESLFLVLPAGMQKAVDSGVKPEVAFYARLRQTVSGVTAALSASRINRIKQRVGDAISDYAIRRSAPAADAAFLKSPAEMAEFVSMDGVTARISVAQVTAFAQSQTYFFPIAVFFIVVISAQMVMTAVASEKENKTLETLLSSPVDRRLLVLSKLSASACIAAIFSGAYMLGMRSFMSGITGALGGEAAVSAHGALAKLGMLITPQGYLLIGVSVLFCILCALAIAFILGALSEDVKSIQGMMTPLMMMLMLSYLLPMFVDLSSASAGLKLLLYAIPFTHAFIAPQNVMSGAAAAVLWGIAYQAAVCALFVTLAGRLFSGESLLTLKLRFDKSLFQRSKNG